LETVNILVIAKSYSIVTWVMGSC